MSLSKELEQLFESHYSLCEHEREIRDAIESEVRQLLFRFGLLEITYNEPCGYCGSEERVLKHKHYCIHMEAE